MKPRNYSQLQRGRKEHQRYDVVNEESAITDILVCHDLRQSWPSFGENSDAWMKRKTRLTC